MPGLDLKQVGLGLGIVAGGLAGVSGIMASPWRVALVREIDRTRIAIATTMKAIDALPDGDAREAMLENLAELEQRLEDLPTKPLTEGGP